MKYMIVIFLLMANLSLLFAQKPVSKNMLKHFDEIEALIPYKDSLNTEVSKVDVAWHLDHSLKVVNRIYQALESSKPEEYRYQASIVRWAAYSWGDFPRGIAKSPSAVLPPEHITTNDIYRQLAEARAKMEQFKALPKNSFYSHFAFKNINRNKSIRFLEVHTNHHLKIIRDILKKK
ncbi:MAG: DUF1569 domain-containing protein [Bacteroidota bacterium]